MQPNSYPSLGTKNGFTLMELVVVLAILMALATTVGLVLGNIISDSKDKAVIVEMRNIKNAILQHYKDTGVYPPEIWTLDGGGTISGFYGLFYDFGPKKSGATTVAITYQGATAQVLLPFTDGDDTNGDGIPQSNEFCNISLNWTGDHNATNAWRPPGSIRHRVRVERAVCRHHGPGPAFGFLERTLPVLSPGRNPEHRGGGAAGGPGFKRPGQDPVHPDHPHFL